MFITEPGNEHSTHIDSIHTEVEAARIVQQHALADEVIMGNLHSFGEASSSAAVEEGTGIVYPHFHVRQFRRVVLALFDDV